MSKGLKFRKITGIALCLIIVAISFFPMVYLDENSSNVMQLLAGLKEEASVPYIALCVVLLIIPVLYAGCFIAYLTGKEAHAFSAAASYIGIIGTMVILGLGAYFMLTTDKAVPVPGTKWLVIRWLLCGLEYVNKRSGEEFFGTMLKE